MSYRLFGYGVNDLAASFTAKQVTVVNAPAINIGLIKDLKLTGVPTFAGTFCGNLTMRFSLSGIVMKHLDHSLPS